MSLTPRKGDGLPTSIPTAALPEERRGVKEKTLEGAVGATKPTYQVRTERIFTTHVAWTGTETVKKDFATNRRLTGKENPYFLFKYPTSTQNREEVNLRENPDSTYARGKDRRRQTTQEISLL